MIEALSTEAMEQVQGGNTEQAKSLEQDVCFTPEEWTTRTYAPCLVLDADQSSSYYSDANGHACGHNKK